MMIVSITIISSVRPSQSWALNKYLDTCQYSPEAYIGKLLFESDIEKEPRTYQEYTISLYTYIYNHSEIDNHNFIGQYFKEYTWCHKNAFNIIEEHMRKLSTKSIPNDTTHYVSKSQMIKYAEDHSFNKNSEYYYYSSDCTNFVSQIYHAGGQPMITDNQYYAWYHYYEWKWIHDDGIIGDHPYKEWHVSPSWRLVDDFRRWISYRKRLADIIHIGIPNQRWSNVYEFESWLDSTIPEGIAFIQADLHQGNGPDHSIFIYKKNGMWWVAYHTQNTNDPLRKIWKEKRVFPNKELWLIKFKYVKE